VHSFDLVKPDLIDVFPSEHDGYPEDLAKEDVASAVWDACGDASRSFPSHLWVEHRDWGNVAALNDERKTWPIHFIDRFTNQRPTHECTCHALRANAECTWNRQRRIVVGPPIAGRRLDVSAKSSSVWFSCLSVYAEANPRQWGGANTRGVLNIASRRGFIPDAIQPKQYNFKHTLTGTAGQGGINQSSGRWISLSNFPRQWEETAAHFRPLEIILPTSVEQIVCLVLNSYAVSIGRNGHAITYAIYNPIQKLLGYVDSYDVVRWDTLATAARGVNASYSIATMTTPDDWDYPAGK